MSSPTSEIRFQECYLATGQSAGVQTHIGWSCSRCGTLVPNITDDPAGPESMLTVHRTWHEENDR